MKFSTSEKKDLLAAGFMISLAFAILFSGGYQALFSLKTSFLLIFAISFLTAGLGFILHELMHKYVAQSYGFYAEFKAFYNMLWLALAASFFGFIFAAPGAVIIRSRGFRQITKEQNGKISLAGPATNIILAVIFLVILFLVSNPLAQVIASYGLTINSLLAAFNMIPVMPFDGAKIKEWNITVYTTTVIIAVGLFILTFFL